MAANAYAMLDSYVYGFVIQQVSLPFDSPGDETADIMRPGYAFGDGFDFGLDLILDGLERALDRESR